MYPNYDSEFGREFEQESKTKTSSNTPFRRLGCSPSGLYAAASQASYG